MIFNSLEYIIFLPLVFIIFYFVQHRFRIFILLIASYYFYMSWNPVYILLIIASTLTDYFAGLGLSKTKKKPYRKLILGISILVNLGLLAFFKYGNFAIENINNILHYFHHHDEPLKALDILLPVGISFYTFQTMSYTIDVYRKTVTCERNFFVFAVYVCFFPQLVAGPIERYNTLAPQLKKPSKITVQNLSFGFRMILYGFFMKMVIADNIGIVVDKTYNDISVKSSVNLIIAAILYSFQIYCDFHGYSTIAVGTARLFNVNLLENFRTPYLTTTITEFWRKWHISLTNWFRDYIYYPMGGNKTTKLKWLLAVITVFLVSGVWHGANWTFVIWGVFHAVLLLAEKLTGYSKKHDSYIINSAKWFITFSLVTLLWVVFRSPDFETTRLYIVSIFHNWDVVPAIFDFELYILVFLFIVADILTRKDNFGKWLDTKPVIIRWSIYFILMFLILTRSGTDMQPFIYFQF